MVDRSTLTAPEIAEKYGVSIHTVTKSWAQHPAWPDAIGKRGRYKAYSPWHIETFVYNHVARPAVALEPRRLYTAREIADAAGISAGTIRADRTRGRWPEPDDVEGGVNRWYGETATMALASRRGYRK
ncbi:hypothetical protein [Streptomyces sp. CC224B]|uniref:hypothetical protein n=1 Tax=Streptomyces sp. CC224B TaxID=3044571 RepID=UPI0024A7BC75|nr:hypothetical protein [Streptomyces sp. CC224B]